MEKFKLYQNLGYTDSSMIEDTHTHIYILMKGTKKKKRKFEYRYEFQLHSNKKQLYPRIIPQKFELGQFPMINKKKEKKNLPLCALH